MYEQHGKIESRIFEQFLCSSSGGMRGNDKEKEEDREGRGRLGGKRKMEREEEARGGKTKPGREGKD